jgi:hypothetical protein
MIRILIILLFCLELITPIYAEDSSRWKTHDVSILLPLPSHLLGEGHLKPNTLAQAGELIPREYFEDLTRDRSSNDFDELYRQIWITGIQIKPCFSIPLLISNELCRPEIQLLWQPLKEQENLNGAKEITVSPSAIHVTYEIPADEFRTFLRGLKQIKSRNPFSMDESASQTQPSFKKQSPEGSFRNDLMEILLAFTGAHRIHRISFESPDTNDSSWKVREFEIIGGKLTKIDSQKRSLFPFFQSFGYWNGKPQISQKRIQQSSEIANHLNLED